MPSITLSNLEDKAAVKRFLSSPSTRIITATVARLYIAYPDPHSWTYAGILGAVALIQTSNTFYLRIVDLLVKSRFAFAVHFFDTVCFDSLQLTHLFPSTLLFWQKNETVWQRHRLGTGDLRRLRLHSGPTLLPHLPGRCKAQKSSRKKATHISYHLPFLDTRIFALKTHSIAYDLSNLCFPPPSSSSLALHDWILLCR